MHFFYDRNGELSGFIYYYLSTGVDDPIQYQYYYVKNVQGDITGITDIFGNLVAKYEYDAWGKLINVESYNGINDPDAANVNPFRYRSYYYDVETGFYYLQSRYYDPEVGRFINCDDVNYIGLTESEVSYNAFAYCENEPVNGIDPEGFCYKDSKGKMHCDLWPYSNLGKMKISESGIKMLKACEDLYLTAYKALPSEKNYTIGYGHYGADVKKGQKITKQEAEKILRKDVKIFEKTLNRFLVKYRIALLQYQFDACIIDSFQKGQNIWLFDDYYITKFLKEQKCFVNKSLYTYSAVQKAFLGGMTNKNDGRYKRRVAESKLFYNAKYCTKGSQIYG